MEMSSWLGHLTVVAEQLAVCREHLELIAANGVEPYAAMLAAADDELIPVFPQDKIHLVVVGGETNGYWRIMGANYQKSVSVDAWR